MKKINGLLILGLAIALGLVVSCEQERLHEAFSSTTNEVESRNAVVISNNVLLDNDMMSFTDEFAFEDFMHYLDSVGVESFLALVNSYGFTSYCNSVTGICVNTTIGNELDEPELMSILNEYSMIHIGDHIMKLNFEEEEVYVLPDDISALEMQQLQLAENAQDVEAILSTPGAEKIIPFQENVFDIINGTSGGNDPQSNNCPEECAKEKSDPKKWSFSCWETNDDIQYCSVDVEARYNQFGIWKRLKIKADQHCSNFNKQGYPINGMNFSYYATWDARCKDKNDGIESGQSDYLDDVKLYGGTRCLSSYSVTADVSFLDVCDETVTISLNSAISD